MVFTYLILFPLILISIGIMLSVKKNKKPAKIFFIIAGIYLVIGLGTYGYLFYNFTL